MPLQVLCVDDEQSWRESIKINLEDTINPQFEAVGSYKAALEKVQQTRYDLIILDGLNGDCFKLYQEILTVPQGNVVILSGDRSLEKQAKDSGIPFYDKGRSGLQKLIADYRHTSE